METYQSTTPFGRRASSLAQMASNAIAKARPLDMAVNKWTVFRFVCAAKTRLGLSERPLAVLDALLSFHPETALTGDSLVVWPSNQQLALRAHGMAPATLRRSLAALVETGIIIRRDSPNGKRYARKGRGGEVDLAFGFDLSPLVARAQEMEGLAAAVAAEERAHKIARERITLCRRDIVKMIAVGRGENVPVGAFDKSMDSWSDVDALYRSIMDRLPRSASREQMEPIARELTALAERIANLLERHAKTQNLSGNESPDERHKQNSNPESPSDFEPGFRESEESTAEPEPVKRSVPLKSYPLGLVLDACPDIADYAKGGIASWRHLLATAAVVRPMLGISPSAWDDACVTMGESEAAVVIAAILQRADDITSPGGYLRALTLKARAGEFSLGPVLMALIGRRKRAGGQPARSTTASWSARG